MKSIVFTDGAAKGNPGPGGWGAVIAMPGDRVVELGGGAAHTTNNQMELTAAIRALEFLRGQPGTVAVHSDSTYVIRGITQWIRGWRRRDWRTAEGQPVLNQALWEALDALARGRGRGGLEWHYVPGHAGVAGNERADAIAVAFAAHRPPDLYDGPLRDYPVPLHELPTDAASSGAVARPRPSRSGLPYSYLSLVDGTPMRHRSWAECEQRVKGVSGARFKKAMSADDEAAILAAWGCSPAQLRS